MYKNIMPIKANFSDSYLKEIMNQFTGAVKDSISDAMKIACLKMVERAKQTNTYKDQTGNLRSSIGYILYHNGKEISRQFEIVKDGEDGIRKGSALARDVASEYGKGFVAVVVAGMNYAAYVEAKGKDVITGSSLGFPKDMEKYLKVVTKQYGIKFIKVR
jgi:hypothetical protein